MKRHAPPRPRRRASTITRSDADGVVERLTERVVLGADGGLVPVAGELAAGERTPGQHADALVDAERKHLALLLAVDEVVVVLHGHEAGPSVLIREEQCLGELPRVHRRRADVAGLAGLHDVVQRFERLLDRRLRIPAMDLVEVDVVGAEPAQAVVDLAQDRLARQTARRSRRRASGRGPSWR